MDKYLASLESSPVRSLKELIEWNKAHAEQALPAIHPQQDKLGKAQGFHMTPEDYKRSLAYVQRMWGGGERH
jgi:amidase